MEGSAGTLFFGTVLEYFQPQGNQSSSRVLKRKLSGAITIHRCTNKDKININKSQINQNIYYGESGM
jgi:hypothetical protein